MGKSAGVVQSTGYEKYLQVDSNGKLFTREGQPGAFSSTVLAATTSAPTSTSVWTSATGCKQFSARIAGTPVAGTGVFVTEGVAVAWSTTVNDDAGVAALLLAAVGQADSTPSGPPTEISNCVLLLLLTDIVAVQWDETTRIKTIGARAIGATPAARNVVIGLVT